MSDFTRKIQYLKGLADGYLQDRLNKAKEELEQAQAKAEQAWDEIVG